MKIGWNGKIMNAQEAVISVYDHGFLYGIGLFETFRTYGGRPFLLEWHLERLEQACNELGIRYTADRPQLTEWMASLMRENGLEEAYVRLTVSAGEGELGLPIGDYDHPNVLLLVKPLPSPAPQLELMGKELRKLRTLRNTPEGAVRFKSLHYMNNIIAKRELAASGAAPGAEGLMLTAEGHLSEGIVSNLFFVTPKRTICTPAIHTGILPGITRRKVIQLARSLGYVVEEGLYGWDALLDAEEIWLTNSIQELVAVTRVVDGEGAETEIGNGLRGPVTEQLLAAYRKETEAS